MLDVHPPEHPAHSWRDFFIHMGTIVLGLLIAIGLEQSVEAVHHHHQRERLLESLRKDAQGAASEADTAAAGMDSEIAYDERVLDSLKQVRQQKGQLRSLPIRQRKSYGTPDDFSWRSAQSSGLLVLLTPEENRTFEMNDWIIRSFEAESDRRRTERRNLNTAWHSLDDMSGNIDLSSASSEELGHLNGLFSTDQIMLQSAKHQLQQITVINSEIAKGHLREDEVEAALHHPDK